ncbi:membrane protease subunit [Silvanigrella sp.]|jgi:regulator of protease activity HflC (stomatin/prohibitin superfamily)|uniref:membrane protease subunit n=1 Tax=Silvanigrella sp. TaxID=2024976 RepID=UPI0037CC988C
MKKSNLIYTIITLTIMVISGFTFYPLYKVWQQEKEGEAELARATSNRKIKILEAEAKKEAAISEALAEIERAKGVAKANEIIGSSLKNNESYLRYLWISNLNGNNKEVIYIPTEANLPILEAGKR